MRSGGKFVLSVLVASWSKPGRFGSIAGSTSLRWRATRSCCWRRARPKSLSPRLLRVRTKARAVSPSRLCLSGRDLEADLAGRVPAAVARIVDGGLDIDRDAADTVDQLAETVEVDRGVVVDRDAEQVADLLGQGGHPALGILLRVLVGVRHQRVDLAHVWLAAGRRQARHVAREADHREVARGRVEAGDEDRVVEGVRSVLVGIDPGQQDVDARPAWPARSAPPSRPERESRRPETARPGSAAARRRDHVPRRRSAVRRRRTNRPGWRRRHGS